MAEKIGDLFPTQVPSYIDPADIRKAFNLYHYGTETVPTLESQIVDQSIAGYIRDVFAAVEAAEIGQTVVLSLTAQDNLNFSDSGPSAPQSGIYKSASGLSNAEATSLNYPINSLGLLNYIKTSDSTYFQTFTSVVESAYFWRVGVKPQVDVVWGTWQRASVTGHIHDDRYYTESEINARLNMNAPGIAGAMTSDRAAIVDSSGRLTSSTATSGDVARLEGLVSSNILGANNLSTFLTSVSSKLPNNQRIFVQATAPSNPTSGDIWLW
jgi:hypothetical protein